MPSGASLGAVETSSTAGENLIAILAPAVLVRGNSHPELKEFPANLRITIGSLVQTVFTNDYKNNFITGVQFRPKAAFIWSLLERAAGASH